MVSECACLDVIAALHGKTTTVTQTHRPGSPEESASKTVEDNALTQSDLYRHLLPRYSLADIDDAIRWLELGGYLKRIEFGLQGMQLYQLNRNGLSLALAGRLPDPVREFLHREKPYQVFIAHQFNEADQALVTYLTDAVLAPAGYSAVSGRADGLEEFRTAIVTKIRNSRFFVCLLTTREELVSGGHASSVWLYQEIGAAVALGKRPLVLVEDGISGAYAGELQSVYEHIPFNRSNHPTAFARVIPRLSSDLEANLIPLPPRSP